MTKKPLTSVELRELTEGLNRLAKNLWWTWSQEAQEIFQELSPRGWQNLYHNAVAILHEVSEYELRVRLQDPNFAERVSEVLRLFEAYMNDKATWVGGREGTAFAGDEGQMTTAGATAKTVQGFHLRWRNATTRVKGLTTCGIEF